MANHMKIAVMSQIPTKDAQHVPVKAPLHVVFLSNTTMPSLLETRKWIGQEGQVHSTLVIKFFLVAVSMPQNWNKSMTAIDAEMTVVKRNRKEAPRLRES